MYCILKDELLLSFYRYIFLSCFLKTYFFFFFLKALKRGGHRETVLIRLTLQMTTTAWAGQVQSRALRGSSSFPKWALRLESLGHALLLSQAEQGGGSGVDQLALKWVPMRCQHHRRISMLCPGARASSYNVCCHINPYYQYSLQIK